MPHDQVGVEAESGVDGQLVVGGTQQRRQPPGLSSVHQQEHYVVRRHQGFQALHIPLSLLTLLLISKTDFKEGRSVLCEIGLSQSVVASAGVSGGEGSTHILDLDVRERVSWHWDVQLHRLSVHQREDRTEPFCGSRGFRPPAVCAILKLVQALPHRIRVRDS